MVVWAKVYVREFKRSRKKGRKTYRWTERHVLAWLPSDWDEPEAVVLTPQEYEELTARAQGQEAQGELDLGPLAREALEELTAYYAGTSVGALRRALRVLRAVLEGRAEDVRAELAKLRAKKPRGRGP